MTDKTVKKSIRDYIIETVFDGQDDGELDEHSPLLEWGILNSLQVLGLIDFIEAKFEIKINPEDLRPQNLESVAAIAVLIQSRVSA